MLDLAQCHAEEYHFWVGVVLQVSILILVVIGVSINALFHKDRLRKKNR